MSQQPKRNEQLAGRTHRASNNDWPRHRVDDLAREFGRGAGEFVRAVLRLVQLQALAVAAERVGQDDVGASFDELPVQIHHLVGSLDGPELRRVTRHQPGSEVVRAGGAIGEQDPSGG